MGLAPSRQLGTERQIATGLRTGWIAFATFLGMIARAVALVVVFEHSIVTADHLHMKVVAEGIETEARGAVVKAAGCEIVQGFLYWRPMPAATVLSLLDPSRQIKALRSV